MNVLAHELVISYRALSGTDIIDPTIHLKVTLRCPHCRTIERVQSGGHMVWGPCSTPLSQLVDWQISKFTSAHDCENCGTLFIPVPRSEKKAFSANLQAKATTEWLEGELEKLRQKGKSEQEKKYGKSVT
ncbi:MAG: hypothetical protein KBC21_04460 [Candidatus Pacebacteria bacterium]|nr:hypothetical protein [Candidatus Paceibacterota bacterium]